jgi:hypothetical protein
MLKKFDQDISVQILENLRKFHNIEIQENLEPKEIKELKDDPSAP